MLEEKTSLFSYTYPDILHLIYERYMRGPVMMIMISIMIMMIMMMMIVDSSMLSLLLYYIDDTRYYT